jgi:hypothetical protein
MKTEKLIFFLFLAYIASHYSFAQQTTIREQNEPLYTEPISARDTIVLGDSIIVIHTVCAPICSSHVRVYNKEWKFIGTIKPYFKSVFPEAYVQDNKLYWRDNDTTDYSPIP